MEAGLVILAACILCIMAYIATILSNKTVIKITDNALPLDTVMPIQSIEDDFLINGNGDISVGYKLFLPEVLSLEASAFENIHTSLENMFRMLPAGTVIHQQTFVYLDKYKNLEYSDNYLYYSNLKNLNGKELIVSYVHLYITFSNKKNNIRNPHGTSILKKAAYPFQKPYNIDSRLKEIAGVILNFESSFDSISDFKINRLNSIELNNALYDYTNLSYNKPTVNAANEVVNPISTNENGDFKIGNQLVSILSLVNEGGSVFQSKEAKIANTTSFGQVKIPNSKNCQAGMVYPITFGMPFDHIVNVVIEVTDTDDTISALQTEKTSMNLISNFYAPAKDKQKEIDLFCDTVRENNYQTTYTAVNVIIHDENKNELSRKTAFANQCFLNMNQSTVYTENEETANLFFSSMPGNARANYRGFVNVIKQALCYLNKENLYISPKTGYLYADRFGNPVRVDLTNSPLIDNKNKILVGPSGSGKSFWLNNYILQSIICRSDIIIIDIGGSFKNLVLLNGGKYFNSNQKEMFQFNPFLCSKDKFGKYDYQQIDTDDSDSKDDQIKTIAAVISYIWKEDQRVTPIEKVILQKSIIAFYEYINDNNIFPNLINYREFLIVYNEKIMDSDERRVFNVTEIRTLLEPYTTGELSFLLNGKEDIDIANDTLIAYDMESASKKEYFPIVAMMTLQVIIQKIKKRRGIAKRLIIDEALDFLTDEKFGEFIAYLYRTFRKKEGEIMIAAQNVKFIQNAAPLIKDSILINSDTKVVLEHGEKYWADIPSLSILSISDSEMNKIKALQRNEDGREFFLKLGNEHFILNNGVSEESAVAFDSREKTVTEIEKLYKQKGSIPAAISAYLDLRKEKISN